MTGATKAELIGRLVREYGERAFSLAYRLTGNAEEAQDLVHEAYRRVLSRWERYDPAQPLENWFFSILRHLYLDAEKRYDRSHLSSLDAPLSSEEEAGSIADRLPGEERDFLDALEEKEAVSAVRGALARLPVHQRAALTLCDAEGMDYGEIARVLGCPRGTVRSRISRARLAVRRLVMKKGVMPG